MRLKNSTYDFLKWFALIALPAFQVFWLTVGKVWNFPYLTEVGATIGAVGLLIATLIGVSTKAYNDFVKLQSAEEPEDSFVDEIDAINDYEVFDYGDEINIEGGDEND